MFNNNELLQKLHQIRLDKEANIKPENIREGVIALGVSGTLKEVNNQDKTIIKNGTYEADEGYTGLGKVTVDIEHIKQFSTVEEMNASVDNEEGNLAVVYNNEYLPLNYNIVTNKLVFPLSVTLDSEPEIIEQREIELDYDTSVFETAQAMITLNAEMFQISVIGLKTNGVTYRNNINYYRQEGTNTYVREFNPETEMYEVDFEVLFMFSGATWSDIFAKFLYYNFAVFAGLFIYNGATWNLAPLPEEFNASDKNMLEGTTAYSNEGVVSGGIMRRGIVDVTPTTEKQTLEDGYYEGVNISGVTSNIDSNIVAENIKKDVNILGVTGTLEEVVINNQNKEITENGTYTADEGYTGLGSVTVNVAGSGGGTVEGMRQFASIDEMNADTSAAVGDISVVYGLAGNPLVVGSKFRKITFPETVNCTVSSTINFASWLEPADDAHMLDIMTARLNATQFYLNVYTDTGTIRVQYSGSNGVYTRKTFSASGDAVIDGDTLDFGMDVQVVTSWNELLNNFFNTEIMSFGGIYEKKTVPDESKIYIKAISDEQYIDTYIDRQKLVDMANIVLADLGWNTFKYFLNNNNEVCAIYCPENPHYVGIVQKDGLLDNPAEDYLGITGQYNAESTKVTRTLIVYKLDLDAKTYSLVGQYSTTSYIQRDSGSYHTYTTAIDIKSIIGSLDVLGGVVDNSRIPTTCGTAWKYGASSISFDPFQATLDVWKPASTQLDTTADSVYQNTFYGVNGVEKGTLQDGTGLTAEQLKTRVEIWNSISELETTDLDLTFCFENYTGKAVPKIDTSKVVNAGYMFYNCTALETVPELDMSSATNVYNIFSGCTALSNESLNNILAMCVTATKYIAAGNNVTLKGLGLTSAQATTCTTLSNWSAASSAGWTTGY